MRAQVITSKCQTNGECVRICPEVFQFSTGGKKAMVVKDPVPREFEEQCVRAAQACPQRAIKLTEVRKNLRL
jgi:ferredoxin